MPREAPTFRSGVIHSWQLGLIALVVGGLVGLVLLVSAQVNQTPPSRSRTSSQDASSDFALLSSDGGGSPASHTHHSCDASPSDSAGSDGGSDGGSSCGSSCGSGCSS